MGLIYLKPDTEETAAYFRNSQRPDSSSPGSPFPKLRVLRGRPAGRASGSEPLFQSIDLGTFPHLTFPRRNDLFKMKAFKTPRVTSFSALRSLMNKKHCPNKTKTNLEVSKGVRRINIHTSQNPRFFFPREKTCLQASTPAFSPSSCRVGPFHRLTVLPPL